MSITVSSSLSSNFSYAAMPGMDRRATSERRVQSNAKPLGESEPSWGRHAFVAGFLGVVLGSTGAIAVLAQRDASNPEPITNLMSVKQPETTVTGTPALFDATPFASAVSAASASSAVASVVSAATGALTAEAAASAESYSEDAAGVPGATYREPPVIQPEASRPPATTAR